MNFSLRSFEIFQGIEEQSLREIQKRSRIRTIGKNERLLYAFDDQHAFFLVKGILKSVTTKSNNEQLIKEFISAGSFVGDLPLIETQERKESFAIAVETSTVIAIHVTFIRQALLNSEEFRVRIKRLIAQKLFVLEDRLSDVIYKSAEERIINFIVELLKKYGKPSGDVLRMKKFITDSDISQYVAASRQTVSVIMNDFRKRGTLSYNSRHLEMPLNSKLLQRRA